MAYTDLTKENFESETTTGLTVIDFWAPWCGPCKLFGPTFKEVSEEIKGMKFYKVNTDEDQDLATKFEIRSIPTVLILKDGEEVDRFSGMFNKEQFTEKLNKFL